MKKLIWIILLLSTVAGYGQQVSDFRLVNVLSNQTVSPGTYPSCSGLVIIFTSNACPYDEYYRGRISKLASAYQDRVPVLLVNAHNDPAEANDAMIKKARDGNWPVPYLSDKDQSLMAALDAKKSPEAFLLKHEGSKFTVVYRGAIDDNAQVESDVRHSYLKEAIEAMLANQKPVAPEVRPVGCNLKKK